MIFQLYWNFRVSNETENEKPTGSFNSFTNWIEQIEFSRVNPLISLMVAAYQRAFVAGIKAITNWMSIHAKCALSSAVLTNRWICFKHHFLWTIQLKWHTHTEREKKWRNKSRRLFKETVLYMKFAILFLKKEKRAVLHIVFKSVSLCSK